MMVVSVDQLKNMKIAIISDSHDNLPNMYKAIEWMNKNGIEEIIHCGDVCAPAALREIAKKFKGKIHLVYGNVDGDHEGMKKKAEESGNVIIYGDEGHLKFGEKKIAFVHYPIIAKELAKSGKYDFVFYGHSHKPWEEMVGNCKMLNPGTLAGMFYKATFAVWDTENNKFELKILELL
ncbi:metallophosphoesterase [Patescibacteria group bacterium]